MTKPQEKCIGHEMYPAQLLRAFFTLINIWQTMLNVNAGKDGTRNVRCQLF
jgi:hypothetical protein